MRYCLGCYARSLLAEDGSVRPLRRGEAEALPGLGEPAS